MVEWVEHRLGAVRLGGVRLGADPLTLSPSRRERGRLRKEFAVPEAGAFPFARVRPFRLAPAPRRTHRRTDPEAVNFSPGAQLHVLFTTLYADGEGVTRRCHQPRRIVFPIPLFHRA